MKTGEQFIRLVLTPQVKTEYAIPAYLQVESDSISLAAKLYFENSQLKQENSQLKHQKNHIEKSLVYSLLRKGKRFLKGILNG